MKTFEKVWNEFNEYGIPKSKFKCVQCMFSLFNKPFEKFPKKFKNIFMRKILNTLLPNGIM